MKFWWTSKNLHKCGSFVGQKFNERTNLFDSTKQKLCTQIKIKTETKRFARGDSVRYNDRIEITSRNKRYKKKFILYRRKWNWSLQTVECGSDFFLAEALKSSLVQNFNWGEIIGILWEKNCCCVFSLNRIESSMRTQCDMLNFQAIQKLFEKWKRTNSFDANIAGTSKQRENRFVTSYSHRKHAYTHLTLRETHVQYNKTHKNENKERSTASRWCKRRPM